jgi:hypothetical protein
VVVIVPGLKVLPAGVATATVQVTAVVAEPEIAAENCTVPPIVAVAGLGVTVIGGTAYLAVTVVSAVNVTLQVTVLLVVQPVHEEKLLPPEVAGAVRTTAEPDA